MGQFIDPPGPGGGKDLKIPDSLKRLAEKGFLKASFTKEEFNEMLCRCGKDILLGKR
jgi:hypothetical protein